MSRSQAGFIALQNKRTKGAVQLLLGDFNVFLNKLFRLYQKPFIGSSSGYNFRTFAAAWNIGDVQGAPPLVRGSGVSPDLPLLQVADTRTLRFSFKRKS